MGGIVKESAYLTAKTSAMVCWLFVGSSIFSASFALLGGQEIINHWVLSLDMTPLQFMILAQIIIFLLGWPLEWTEIIVIFMPIFIPLLPHFQIDPLFFGLLVALNLQTAFLSPPVAMAAFYPQGRLAEARDAQCDLRRHDAVHGDPGSRADPAVYLPGNRHVASANAVQVAPHTSCMPRAARGNLAVTATRRHRRTTGAHHAGGIHARQRNHAHQGQDAVHHDTEGVVMDAVKVMAENDIGSLVVMEGGKLAGMLTFREVLAAMAAREGSLANVRVADIYKHDPLTAAPSLDVMELRGTMLERHAPTSR